MTPAARAKLVIPKLRDPRVTLCVLLTMYTVLGQTVLYFNRDIKQLVLCVVTACAAEMLLAWLFTRSVLLPPLSAYITGLSIGLLAFSFAILFMLALMNRRHARRTVA